MSGKVTKIVPFGAFVEIGDAVEGLVHISEMAKGHVEKAEDVVAVGKEVQVKIMDVDVERRRISLSLRAANEELGIEEEELPAPSGDEEVVEVEGADETEAVEAEVEVTEEVVEAPEAVEAEVAEAAEETAE